MLVEIGKCHSDLINSNNYKCMSSDLEIKRLVTYTLNYTTMLLQALENKAYKNMYLFADTFQLATHDLTQKHF